MLAIHPKTHVQNVPSSVWTITHGFATKPVVSVKVLENGAIEEILPKSVTFLDSSTVVITFSSPRTGEARLA